MDKPILRPLITYGSEVWVMINAQEDTLAHWKRKVVRKIYGPIRHGAIWRSRTNEELY